MNVKLILLVFAFVLFALSAIPYPYAAPATAPQYWPYRIQLIAAGLACWVGSVLFS
jgi:hypothetical protein